MTHVNAAEEWLSSSSVATWSLFVCGHHTDLPMSALGLCTEGFCRNSASAVLLHQDRKCEVIERLCRIQIPRARNGLQSYVHVAVYIASFPPTTSSNKMAAAILLAEVVGGNETAVYLVVYLWSSALPHSVYTSVYIGYTFDGDGDSFLTSTSKVKFDSYSGSDFIATDRLGLPIDIYGLPSYRQPV